MVAETKKMLDPKIKLTATCVRVPVFIGHSEAVNVEFEKPISADEAREILREAPGCLVVDKRENGGYVTPLEIGGRGCDLYLPHPRIRLSRTAFPCGSSPTICVRAQPSIPYRSPNFSSRRPHNAEEEGGIKTTVVAEEACLATLPHAGLLPRETNLRLREPQYGGTSRVCGISGIDVADAAERS